MLIIKDLIIWGFSIYIYIGNSITDLYNTIIVYDCIECSINIILDVINTKKINISKYTIFENIVDKYTFYSLIIISSLIIHNYFYINYNIYINSLLLIACIEPIKLAIIKSEQFNKLYNEVSILNEENAIKRNIRLTLADLTGKTIREAFELLGIQSPERM
jgi:hypothetical protein